MRGNGCKTRKDTRGGREKPSVGLVKVMVQRKYRGVEILRVLVVKEDLKKKEGRNERRSRDMLDS